VTTQPGEPRPAHDAIQLAALAAFLVGIIVVWILAW
jgi:hypothetical protein